jgi:uncharacterized protein YjbI with pentapeptide repeats
LLEADLVRKVGGSAPVVSLQDADLHGTSLTADDLHGATLSLADLHGAILLGTDLSGADLFGADLSDAFLFDADLSDADLIEAHGWTEDQLSEAKSLKGATMPNEQKYEDWLKDKEGGKNE